MKNLLIGAPMWGHSDWKNVFFNRHVSNNTQLNQYASYYTTVEGNTTFYALPSADKVQQWLDQTPKGFKFCFKIPQTISHQLGLTAGIDDTWQFIELLQPMLAQQKIAQIMLQLPPQFSGRQLSELDYFLTTFSEVIPLAVEVRHLDYFAKGESERDLNRLLMAHNVNRVMMDTRPVHSEKPINAAIIDAQRKKPKVPVHVLATGQQPIIRYVGKMNLEQNKDFIRSWLKPIKQWLGEGKQVILFIHTADNANIHKLTRLWLHELTEYLGYCPFDDGLFPVEQEQKENGRQDSLF